MSCGLALLYWKSDCRPNKIWVCLVASFLMRRSYIQCFETFPWKADLGKKSMSPSSSFLGFPLAKTTELSVCTRGLNNPFKPLRACSSSLQQRQSVYYASCVFSPGRASYQLSISLRHMYTHSGKLAEKGSSCSLKTLNEQLQQGRLYWN